MKKLINFTAIALISFTYLSCKKDSPLQALHDNVPAKSQLKEVNACTSPPKILAVRTAGSTGYDYGRDVYLHPSGIVALTGGFEGTVDFDPGPGQKNLTSVEYGSGFSQWFSRDAKFVNAVVEPPYSWVYDYGAKLLPRDKDGNIYEVVFEDGAVTEESRFQCAAAEKNIGATKKGPAGNILWKKIYSSMPNWCLFSHPTAVKTPNNNMIISFVGSWIKYDTNGQSVPINLPHMGTSSATFWVDKQEKVYLSRGNAIEKYDSATGKLLGAVNATATDLGFDDAGNIYAVGTFTGTRDFDPGAGVFTMTASVNKAIYIQKFSAAGKFIWAKQVGAGTPYDIVPEANGQYIFIAGAFSGTQTYNTVSGSVTVTSNGGTDAFIMALRQCN